MNSLILPQLKLYTRSFMYLLPLSLLIGACGSQEKKPTLGKLAISDEMNFPSKDKARIALEDIPEGNYKMKEVRIYTEQSGFNRVLYTLTLSKAGTPDRKKDSLDVKAAWDDEADEGGMVMLQGPIPLRASMTREGFTLLDYRQATLEASNGNDPSYSLETPEEQGGKYSAVFSEFATNNSQVYQILGMKGVIFAKDKVLWLYTTSTEKGFTITTRFTFVRP
jgi:hypothetical protein